MFVSIPSHRPEMQPGDIIGFSGDCWMSAVINLATYGIPYWSLSHVGILGEYHQRLVLFEAGELPSTACLVTGRTVAGSKAVLLEERLATYEGKAWHYPLYRTLYDFERKRLQDFLMSTLGLPYDGIGAIRAGGIGWSWFESQLRPADLSAIFCSELVCAAHTHLGIFQTDYVSRWSPNRLVRAERRHGILKAPWRLK